MTSKLRIALASILAVAALGAIAPAANAYVYWVDSTQGVISRADNDGTNAISQFIVPQDGHLATYGVAVDANHIYWTDTDNGTIGRADLDGSNRNDTFITGAGRPFGIAVDSGHIYWTSNTANAGSYDHIYSANLNGSSPGIRLTLAAGTDPLGIAVDSNYVYWAAYGQGAINRSTLNWSTISNNWIPASAVASVAVSPSRIYGSTDAGAGESNIFSTNLSGSDPQSVVTGASNTRGLAVDASKLYWGNDGTSKIGRSGLDGSNPNQSFISGAGAVKGVAVDSLDIAGSFSPTSNDFGNQLVSAGETSTVTFTLTSTGTLPLVLSTGPAVYGDASDFQVKSQTCKSGAAAVAGGTSLANGETCVITIAFDPTSPGAKAATYQIATNDGTKSVNLHGTGTAPAGSLSPSAYDFDSHYVATETQATFTLTSSGSADLDLEGIGFSGVGAENFGFTDAGTCSVETTSLSNGQSCTVVVNFYPYTTGFKSATLNVATNDGLKTVNMTGVGIIDPTIVGSGKPTKVSLKVKIGCGDDNACLLQLTGKKVGTNAAVTPKTISVGAGQQPVVTLAYSKALKKAIAKGGRIAVTATNNTSNTSKSVTLRVTR